MSGSNITDRGKEGAYLWPVVRRGRANELESLIELVHRCFTRKQWLQCVELSEDATTEVVGWWGGGAAIKAKVIICVTPTPTPNKTLALSPAPTPTLTPTHHAKMSTGLL